MNEALSYLTEADWTLLRAHARELAYERDDVIVREATEPPGVMLLRSGTARVEQNRGDMVATLTRMGPGELFGEMSMLEDISASASVVAEDSVIVELFERGHIEALLQSDPGFSARFHRSIAIHLSRRLRERSQLISQLDMQSVAQVKRFHTTRLGQISSQQLPRDIVAEVERFKAAMATIEAKRSSSPGRDLDDACTRLLAALDRNTRADAIFEIGYADLASFRDPGQLAGGVGAYVFRQTFSWFMSAATVARAYMKPRGFAEDHETMEMVYDPDPDGDGVIGPLVDHFYLRRPVCQSRREGRVHAQRLLRSVVVAGEPTSIACLACGRGLEAINLLAEPAFSNARLTCVDLDHEALAAAARLAEDRGLTGRIAFVHGNVVPAGGELSISIGQHHAIYTLGLVEYLDDEQCVRLFDWAETALLPGGTFAVHTLSADNADRSFMEHILEWHVYHRTRDEVAALFSRSRFGNEPQIETDAAGAGLFVRVTRT
jgi:extracellular factor (EF) 3-hydroxypalmitic acid methyl ester biosynthesis protein